MFEMRPIVATEALVVLGGNMRLRAAKAAGLAQVPVIIASDLTEAQKREFIIKDNVGFGEWEWESILADWPEAPGWGLDIPEFAMPKPEASEDDYEIPDEIETDIVLGDLFEIGPHRLVCGSSTEADVVDRVLDGAVPNLMVTDPPYGVEYDPQWRHRAGINNSSRTGSVQNDDNARWLESYNLFPGNVIYIWCASLRSALVHQDIIDAGFIPNYLIIWNKQQMVFGRGHYHWKHEPCWQATRKGKSHDWIGDRKQTTVWDIDNLLSKHDSDSKTVHGTQKPIQCMGRPIRNHSGDVYDPFLGSGTTMVAAHQLNRKCYGIEIDPKYCQVIVDRMRKLDPSFVITKNGVPLI
jgi:DNA modification methylase